MPMTRWNYHPNNSHTLMSRTLRHLRRQMHTTHGGYTIWPLSRLHTRHCLQVAVSIPCSSSTSRKLKQKVLPALACACSCTFTIEMSWKPKRALMILHVAVFALGGLPGKRSLLTSTTASDLTSSSFQDNQTTFPPNHPNRIRFSTRRCFSLSRAWKTKSRLTFTTIFAACRGVGRLSTM